MRSTSASFSTCYPPQRCLSARNGGARRDRGGHSKSFAMTGWRLGYAVLATREEALLFEQLNINLVSCVPPFIQEAAAIALHDPRGCGGGADSARAPRAQGLDRPRPQRGRRHHPAASRKAPVFVDVAEMCHNLGVVEAHRDLPRARRGDGRPPVSSRCSSCIATEWPPRIAPHSAPWEPKNSTTSGCLRHRPHPAARGSGANPLSCA